MSRDSNLLTSNAVAKMLGVTVSTVKRWADSGVLSHTRTMGGHRRFFLQDIERFTARDQGFIDRWIGLLGNEVSEFRRGAELLLLRERAGSWAAAISSVITVVYEVGSCWRAGSLTDDYAQKAFTRLQHTLSFAAKTITVEPDSPCCLLAVPSKEEHNIALSVLQVCLREIGWQSCFLQDEQISLVETIRSGVLNINAVALSASAYACGHLHLKHIAAQLGDSCAERNIPLLLGGTGPWPDPPKYGYRLHSFRRFQDILSQEMLG